MGQNRRQLLPTTFIRTETIFFLFKWEKIKGTTFLNSSLTLARVYLKAASVIGFETVTLPNVTPCTNRKRRAVLIRSTHSEEI